MNWLFVKSNALVDFLAERQLQQVAFDASNLGKLTAYRYAVEVGSDGSFIIRDDAMEDTAAPCTPCPAAKHFYIVALA